MPVFQRSKFFISLASLPVSCLIAGSLLAQEDTVTDLLPVFESLPSLEASTLPVPPRQLPALQVSDGHSSNANNPYADQFRSDDGEQLEPIVASPKTELPPPPNFSSNVKNWRQVFEGPMLNLDRAAPELSSTLPVPPTIESPETAVRPIRVAKAEQLGLNLPPTDGPSAPVVEGGNLSQALQAPGGDFVPNNLSAASPGNQVGLADSTQVEIPDVPSALLPEIRSTPSVSKGHSKSQEFEPWLPLQPAANETKADEVEADEFDTTNLAEDPRYLATVNEGQDESLVWWKNEIQAATIPGGSLQSVETNGLVFFMLQRSPRLRAVSQNPLIREQRIVEAEAEFDPVSFLQSQWQDRVDPVGDDLSLTTDGTNFLDDHIWTSDLGVRKKTTTGALVELNQRLGFRNSNSRFFNPQDQGTAALSLNVSQPLLRGRGKYFNQSQILIAQAATNASWDTLAIELQDEVQSVVESYWRLYFDRCVFLQKQKNVERAQVVLEKLEGRAELDSLPNQIARARSAVLSRKTELANARRDIRNSETDIRRLTADSNWAASQMVELLPIELPDLYIPIADLEQVITTAISNRPEIQEAVKRSKIAAIQRDVSVNELLPELSLLLGTYVSALEGDSRLGDAFIDQFGSVKPGYSVGVEFEMPIRNRSARSRLTQRKLQINLIKAEIEETLQNVIAESQIARRRVASAKETLVAATEAIRASRMDLEQNQGRWESFALIEGDIAEGQSPTIVLDQLLDSQTRLVEAEFVYTQAEMELKIAEVALQRTMGTLLTHQSVNFSRGRSDGTPTVDLGVAR